jgi:hypothetical protein
MWCSECGADKSPDEFNLNERLRSGPNRLCKICYNARTRDSVRRNGGARKYHLKGKYGLTPDEFDALRSAQGGLCAVCGVKEATQVDHDHKTSRVRGILCLPCNAGMGAFHDDPRLIYMAIDYLSPQPIEDLVE